MLEKLGKLLQGRKTYIVAILAGIGVVLEMLGINIPWAIVAPILGMLGLGSVRSAISKIEKPSA